MNEKRRQTKQFSEVMLQWLGGEAPKRPVGVTWGVPWAEGTLRRSEALALYVTENETPPSSAQSAPLQEVPLQTWPTAFWPDGSVKWTAHAAVLPAASRRLLLRKTPSASAALSAHAESPLSVTGTEEELVVDTGVLRCRFHRTGTDIIRELTLTRSGLTVCSGARLVGIRQSGGENGANDADNVKGPIRGLETATAGEEGESCEHEPVSHKTGGKQGQPQDTFDLAGAETVVRSPFFSEIRQVIAEQTGPQRAVIKVSGVHRLCGEAREWLPFTLRFYFYAGQADLRIMHTFLYDGEPHRDFIGGIGLSFDVPLRGPLYNRHVRIAGDTGWFRESPQGLMMFRLSEEAAALYRKQMRGESLALEDGKHAELRRLLEDAAVWNGFKLVQTSADAYTIFKRTQPGCAWIRAAAGHRSQGVLYAGGEGGGLAVGVRNFWQKPPASLELDNMAGSRAALTVWLWSPEAEAMDLRHYDTRTHVLSAYEGAEEMRSTPFGIGHTSEMVLFCRDQTPDMDDLNEMARQKESPPLLVCEPAHYRAAGVFGVWSLADRSTPLKARVEDTLDSIVRFYLREVEQRRWYGFWDYGDIMHSYDPVRHTWRYDIGGCAWQNTELAPNYWLWYMFLRSGREDIFRFAEAMTRHTSETDIYHLGEYAGLGSRHNVLHWGCGCKEARIAMAGLHRFYYYLTADERTGEIMDEVRDADFATLALDPMRAYFAKDEFPTHTRSGPDWAAFCSNWMTRWERYEDGVYRDKIKRGIECLKQMPDRLLTGPVFGYDPRNGKLHYMGDENYTHHLIICMGGAQVWIELAMLLKDAEWESMLAEFGEFYLLPPEHKRRYTSGRITGKDWNIPMLATTMAAYAASRTGNAALARTVWDILLGDRDSSPWNIAAPLSEVPVPEGEYVRPIREMPSLSTNTASQWSINVIVCLALIGDYLEPS